MLEEMSRFHISDGVLVSGGIVCDGFRYRFVILSSISLSSNLQSIVITVLKSLHLLIAF